MRGRDLMPWRRRSLLPGLFDFDMDDFFDLFNFQTIKTDLRETENEYILEADLPGFDKSGIEIRHEGNILTISAQQNEDVEEKNENYIHRERRRGSFQRSFTLPDNVNHDAIKASFNNGVLRIVLPKTAPSRPNGRIIDIE